MLEEVGILKIGNVGDCGLKLLREGQIIFATAPQEHYFDCPYQLSSEGSAQTYLDASVNKSLPLFMICASIVPLYHFFCISSSLA
jgi:hypothetical protein